MKKVMRIFPLRQSTKKGEYSACFAFLHGDKNAVFRKREFENAPAFYNARLYYKLGGSICANNSTCGRDYALSGCPTQSKWGYPDSACVTERKSVDDMSRPPFWAFVASSSMLCSFHR